MKTKAHIALVREYSEDVRRNPSHFKLSVSANPEAAAEALIDGMDDIEVRQMLNYLRAELKAIS